MFRSTLFYQMPSNCLYLDRACPALKVPTVPHARVPIWYRLNSHPLQMTCAP